MWTADLRQPDSWVEEAKWLLSPDERERAARGTPEVRRRRLVARAALRIALGRKLAKPPESLELVAGERGKPALADGALEFSASTTDDVWVLAVTTAAAIGVDVERVVARERLERIVATRFAPAEAEAIAGLSGDARLRAFYNCWTRKEAYLKATGTGLNRPLDAVVVSADDERPRILSLSDDDPGAWAIAVLDLGPDLACAVVVRRPADVPAGPLPVRPLALSGP